MTKFLAGALLFAVISALVWTSVLWHWESTQHSMSMSDLVVYLGLLPLACFGLLLALRWAWLGAGERAVNATTAARAASTALAAGGAAPEPGGDAASRHATTLLLGAWLRSAAGEAAIELMDAAQAGAPRPALDAELRDDHGLPLVAARIADLDTAQTEDALAPLVAAMLVQRPEWHGLQAPPHLLRALTALQAPLVAALAAIQPWSERFAPAAPPRPAPSPSPSPSPLRKVRLLLALPDTWSDFERSLAQRWVEQLVQERSPHIAAASFRIEAHATHGPGLWLEADRLLQTQAHEARDDLLLLAACHSDIGDAAVATLEQAQRLFSAAARPKGVMPGEAAAALLLAQPGWPAAAPDEPPFVHLHRPAVLRRDKSIDAAGKVSSDWLQHACTQALAAAQLQAADLKSLVCDADQHSARSTELFGSTLALLPELDPTEDMRLLGTVTGHVGAVATLAVVAAAAAQALASAAPCAALSLGDPFFRLALIARPAADPPATPPVH